MRTIANFRNFSILGTATAFPQELGRWVENDEIHALKYGPDWSEALELKGYDPDYFRKRYGFFRRYWVHTPGMQFNENVATSADLMEMAVREVLENADCSASQIDVFIAFTTTSPRYTSSIATIVAGRTGLKCAALEIKSGCSSAVYAMVLAYQFLHSGAANVLVAGADTLSKVADPARSHVYAAADGGAAVILGHSDNNESGLEGFVLDSDGTYSGAMGVPGALPPIRSELEKNKYMMQISGEANQIILGTWRRIPEELYELSGLQAADINLFVPHQANRELFHASALSAGIDTRKIADYVADIGNCGPCSVLAALDMSLKSKRIGKGDRIMMLAVGGGIAWGGMLLRI